MECETLHHRSVKTERALETLADVVEVLETSLKFVKSLSMMTHSEFQDFMLKSKMTKPSAAKKYYEKNKEIINEARKAKYADKKSKSDDEKSLETITTVVNGEVVRIKIDMSGDIPVFNVPADIMTPVDKKPRKPRAKVVAKVIPVENQEEFMKAVKKIE